ncbi:PilW family protein [Moraxella canis]|uniref:Pilus assembly protein PilW n=1 Tax=Moraxella canis TaxID=90239 RepID=A0A1S9ZLS0_9GAMM|nr:pilus assembly protein PilW [Moraxella canis]OOR84485.1 pilus assembly protein PilW [Moraxella canis]
MRVILTKNQQGMTVMELVVALGLGSLIILMAVSLYASSAKNSAQTYSIAQFIDRETLGIAAMTEQLRLTGIGMMDAPAVLVNRDELTGITTSQSINLNRQLSQTGGLPSHYAKSSDQLTIRYIAPADMWDCEGDVVLGPRRARLKNGNMSMVDGQVVIERYFVETEADGSLSLRCDAGRYITDDIVRDSTRDRRGISAPYITAIIDTQVSKRFGTDKPHHIRGLGKGDVILSDIEGFWVQLIVDDGTLRRSMTIEDYQARWYGYPIVGVQLAILSRSSPAPNTIKTQDFLIFDDVISPPDDGLPRRLHMMTVNFVNVFQNHLKTSQSSRIIHE